MCFVLSFTMTTAKRFALSYIVTAIAFLSLDFIWLSVTSSRLYQAVLSPHLAEHYNWTAVAGFYALYFLGITIFAVRPLETPRAQRLVAAGRGILLGLVAYGTYDLTNQATLSGWPWTLTLIDMLWGAFATGCAAWVTCTVVRK